MVIKRFERHQLRRAIFHPALASTLLWGLLELIALQGTRRTRRAKKR